MSPAPVCGLRAENCIARGAACVEVVTPVVGPRNMDDIPHPVFSISIVSANAVRRLLPDHNLLRIALGGLPVVEILQTPKLDWLAQHLSYMFSRRELELLGSSVSGGAHKGRRVIFKENILHFPLRFGGIQRQ